RSVYIRFPILCALFLFLVYVQEVKTVFRNVAWYTDITGTRHINVSTKSINTSLKSATSIFDKDINEIFKPICRRLNQGHHIALAINHLNSSNSLSYPGRVTIVSPLISLVPRLLWPGKPLSSGPELYYWNYTGKVLQDYNSSKLGFFGDIIVDYKLLSAPILLLFVLLVLFIYYKINTKNKIDFLTLFIIVMSSFYIVEQSITENFGASMKILILNKSLLIIFKQK
ncbi:hypothetical protein OAF65_11040, partial [Verrucomicrobiales bacterium]|nr:hypothetical protein [Verrucomicrobiales bacterium]